MLKILIENEASYRHFVETVPQAGARQWHTTSPWLLEKLPLLGEEVRSLEEGIAQEEINELGFLCKALSRRIADHLDDQIGTLAHGIRLGEVLLVRIRRGLFPLLYKGVLLERWIKEVAAGGYPGFVVGSLSLGGRGLLLSRFDTVYALLAKLYDLPGGVRTVEAPAADSEKAMDRIKRLGTSRAERLLSILNFNPELFAFKVWKRFLGSRPLVMRKSRGKPTIAMLEDCELTEETFMHLLLQGCGVRRLRTLTAQRGEEAPGGTPLLPVDRVREMFLSAMSPFPSLGPLIGDSMLPVVTLFSRMLEQEVSFCNKTLEKLEDYGQTILRERKGTGDPALGILSNGLFSPGERMMYPLFREKGIPVFVCEHGITSGLSFMTEQLQDEDPLRVSDVALCYNETSREFHAGNGNPDIKCFVTGMPKVNKTVRIRKAQGILARRMLGLPLKGRVIVFVSNLHFNNYIYSPGSCSDTFYHRFKRRVVYDILGRLPHACLLKLYPTLRYPDPDPFAGLMELPPNLRSAQFFEYRYLRAVGDVILCDSPQSTLGWVWSARVPLIYLDLPSNPLVPPVADAFDKAIFRFDCSKEGWEEDVRRLLALPEEEFAAQWKAKEPARKEVEEKVVFGPPGRAGKRAADFVVRETLKRFQGPEA